MNTATTASSLLVLTLSAFFLAELMGATGPWAWVKAGSEAAAVGALADWFAVVVLFRHPFGLKLPHTAIVPTNKSRIADSMAAFVQTHFLKREILLDQLARFNVSQRFVDWLQQPMKVRSFMQVARLFLLKTARTLDDEPIHQALATALISQALRLNAAAWLAQVLGYFKKGNRHQTVLDSGLRQVSQLLDKPQVRNFVSQLILAYVKDTYPKIHSVVDTVSSVDRLSQSVAGELQVLIIQKIQAVLNNPQHPLRCQFSDWVDVILHDLRTNSELQQYLNKVKNQWVQAPEVHIFLRSVWSDFRVHLLNDLEKKDSIVANHAERALYALGFQLSNDEGLRASANHYFEKVTSDMVDTLGHGIPLHIANTIKNWDDAQLVAELERNVASDLQFIRINGSLIGAFLGLIFHGLHLLING